MHRRRSFPRRGPLPALVVLVVLVVLAAACDDDGGKPAATPPATTAPATTSAAVTPAPGAMPAPSPTPAPAATPGRVDGTIAPQGFGGAEPVTIKANPDPLTGSALLRAVRLGVHPEEGGWDRIVLEFADGLPPGSVAYVPAASACGSGAPIGLPGNAVLLVRFTQAAAHTEAGQPTVPRALIGAGSVILEARVACDFEGVVEWAIAVRDRQRFKVTLLDRPRRVVIDVKQ